MQMPRKSLVAAGFAAVSLFALPAMAGPLVIRATGPSAALFKPGQRLGDTPMMLRKGDLVVILDRKGTRLFSGPGLLDPQMASKPAEDRIDLSAPLLPDGTRPVIAATRQMLLAQPNAAEQGLRAFNPVPDDRLWQVSLAATEPQCLLPGKPVTVVRSAVKTPATLMLTTAGRSPIKLAFAAAEARKTLPAGTIVASGRYRVSGNGKPLDLRLLPQIASSDRLAALEQIVQGLAAAGCQRQFVQLADQIAPR